MTNAALNRSHTSFTFGVELETVGLGLHEAALAISREVGGCVESHYGSHGLEYHAVMCDGRHWTAVADGSIGHGNAEVVSPILQYADIDMLQRVTRALRAAGAKVDQRCGMHVHVGARELQARDLTNLVNLTVKFDALIKASITLLPNRAGWCKALPANVVEAINTSKPQTLEAFACCWYNASSQCDRVRYSLLSDRIADHYDGSRYHGLNLHSFFYQSRGMTAPRRTVEFRYFNGTLHAGEVRANVLLCLAMVAKAMNARSIKGGVASADAKSLNAFCKTLGMVGEEFDNPRVHLAKAFGKGKTNGFAAARAAWVTIRARRAAAAAAQQ